MKIRVAFTVDVDAKGWADEYGMEVWEVRADVQKMLEQVAVSHVEQLGLLEEQA